MDEKEKKAPEEAEQREPEQKEEKTFTQEDVNNIVAKEVAKALKKAAKSSPAQPVQQPAQEPDPAQPAAAPVSDPEKDALEKELLLARAQIAAVQEGVDPKAAEDAVYLALRAAEKAGELDEDGVRDALKEVLKRHPEWSRKKQEQSGFQVGAQGGEEKAGRVLPMGRVIF